MLFVALKELISLTAESINNTLLSALDELGFNNEYLKRNLIAFCSDGASTMLGRKSGVAARLTEKFPNIFIWHCLNHRLQLALDDSVSAIKQTNYFKCFLDKIHSIYNQSNKNQVELATVAQELNIEIIKIGRVLGPRWAACSLRSATAVWRAYPALYQHFVQSEAFTGMAKRLSNMNFLKDLALMIDILEEFSLLSLGLQSRKTSIKKGQKLILRTIRAFELLKATQGKHEQEIDVLLRSENFKKIPFYEDKKYTFLPRDKLLEKIIYFMNSRLSESNTNLDLLDLLDESTWPFETITSPWIEGEKMLSQLNKIIKYKIDTNEFRDFVDNNIQCMNNFVPKTIAEARKIISTIAISSAEAERGFSLMNLMCTKLRNMLTIEHISDFMTINLLGKELKDWDATCSVKSWIGSNHRNATDTRVRPKKEKTPSENQLLTWKLL